jgi:hypothetical protein
MRNPLAWLIVVAMIGAAVAGCGGSGALTAGSSGNAGGGGTTTQSGTAAIRIIMASPDYITLNGVAAVDVYIDGTRVWQNVSYGNFNGKAGGQANPPYYVTSVQGAPLSPSAHNIQVYPAGAAPGNASQLATTTTTPGAVRTTVVIADKSAGVTPPTLQAIPFTEPTLEAPPGTSSNVVLHHAAPDGAPGLVAYGKLSVTTSSTGVTIKTTCLGNLTFSNPPGPQSMKTIPLVRTGGSPIGYYFAGTGLSACKIAFADFFPASAATPPPVPISAGASPPPTLGGFPNSGVVYPTPLPNAPGQPSPPPYDCDSTLPPLCHGVPPNPEATPANPLATAPNLSIYLIDAPPVPPSTTIGVMVIGVFDTNTQ